MTSESASNPAYPADCSSPKNMQGKPVPVLSCRGVTKRFGPVVANSGVNLDIYPGQIHAILGENGAGKSTLMSVLAGRYRPDEGEIVIDGEATRITSPAHAQKIGIGMVYQRFMLVTPLTVTENIMLAVRGPLARKAWGGRATAKRVRARILELAERYGLQVDPDRRVADLSMGERQRVEILKLLVQDARILIFDEPTAVLAKPEVEVFFNVLRRLRADGRAVLFITHKLEEVLSVSDRISILRRGRFIAHLKAGDVNDAGAKRELARLMVGREVVLRLEKPEMERGETVISLRDLTARPGGDASDGPPPFRSISFDVRRGEVFAVIGVAGNGQSELAAAVAGTLPAASGTVNFQGRSLNAAEWAAAPREIRDAIAYVPEDRHYTGSVDSMPLTENFLLTRFRSSGDGLWLDRSTMREDTENAIRDFAIRASGPDALASQLSGGNLQKLILARELAGSPALFIAEQPTQGLDLGATEDIWRAILRQREKSAVLLVTGDLKEALSLADRIAVMFRGEFLEILDASDENALNRIGLLMAGADVSGAPKAPASEDLPAKGDRK